MKTVFIFFTLSIYMIFSCSKLEDITKVNSNGVATQLPHIWSASTTDKLPVYGLYQGLIYKNGVLCIGMKDNPTYSTHGEPYFIMKDVNTGKTLWEWNDKLPTHHFNSIFENVFFEGSKMILVDGGFHYCIDLETGKTIWKKRQNMNFRSIITNIGSDYFLMGNPNQTALENKYKEALYESSTDTGTPINILTPNYDSKYAKTSGNQTWIGGLGGVAPIIYMSDTLLIVPFTEMGEQNQFINTYSFFGLYNKSQKKWIYEKISLNLDDGGGVYLRPILKNNKIYIQTMFNIGCFDLLTGQKIWYQRIIPDNTAFGDIIWNNGKLLANGLDGVIYCVNAETGNVDWKQKSNGSTSLIYCQDGVVYCIGETLKAIEVATGKLLWDMPSPDIRLNKISDSWFQGFVTGVPAKDGQKGKIIATTDHSIYCFEAVR